MFLIKTWTLPLDVQRVNQEDLFTNYVITARQKSWDAKCST